MKEASFNFILAFTAKLQDLYLKIIHLIGDDKLGLGFSKIIVAKSFVLGWCG